jgi:hypothetical protein
VIQTVNQFKLKLAAFRTRHFESGTDLNALRVEIGRSQINLNNFLGTPRRFLWEYEVKVFSQWGEDGIIAFLLHQLQMVKPRVLEIGAGDFTECNSRFIVEGLNASAYLVDGRDDLISSVSKSGLLWKSSLFAETIFVTIENVSDIWKRATQALGKLGLVSMDLDGNDYWLLKELPLDSASIVVCEYNPILGYKHELSIPYSDNFDRTQAHHSNLYYGMSLLAAIRLLQDKGFTFVGSNLVGNNAFFVRNDLIHKISIPIPNHSELSVFCDWQIRESRDAVGNLTYLNTSDGLKEIQDCLVINLESGELVKIGEIEIF